MSSTIFLQDVRDACHNSTMLLRGQTEISVKICSFKTNPALQAADPPREFTPKPRSPGRLVRAAVRNSPRERHTSVGCGKPQFV